MVHPRYRLFCTGLLCLLYILDHPSARLNVISHHQTEVLYSTVLPSNKPHLSHFTRHIVLTSIPSLPYFLASSHYFILPAPCIRTSRHPFFFLLYTTCSRYSFSILHCLISPDQRGCLQKQRKMAIVTTTSSGKTCHILKRLGSWRTSPDLGFKSRSVVNEIEGRRSLIMSAMTNHYQPERKIVFILVIKL